MKTPATPMTPKVSTVNYDNVVEKIDNCGDSGVYIELDPFAPPPRLSLAGSLSIQQSPASTPSNVQMRKAPLAPFSGGILFEQLSTSGIAIKSVVNDWMKMYESEKERKETVALLLVNFILWSSRVEDDIRPENFVTESASQILHDLQEKIEPTTQNKSDFPLLERNKKFRIFRTQFSDFWSAWADSVFPAAKDLELIEKVILPWLISMSSAGYRPIRYAATLAVLDIVQGCCKACVSMQKKLETSSRVMSSKKGLASKKSVEAIGTRMAEIEKLMQMSIDAVFVQRYRDIDALLREKCVEKIHSWIMTYPEVFLDNAYLRYIGWSLSDKICNVRIASLTAWQSICGRVEFRPALTNFVNRFKSRLFEVLSRDVDKSCREAAGTVIDILFTGSFLEVDELSFIDDLIFSGDPTISTLKELMSKRIFNLPQDKISSSSETLNRFASFVVPYINSETSAETNNFILKQLISNLREHFPILSERSLSSNLLKTLISQENETDNDNDQNMEQSETSEKISCLLAILFAQVQSVKECKGGNMWKFDDSAELFNFVNNLIKFINDNEREIYSKDIFYLFSLLNEVESNDWIEIAGASTWESLFPILTELFCSIDDLESAKVALIFFKKAKSVSVLTDKLMECIELGKERLLNELLNKIPGNMREALKIKDYTLLNLVLPLSHINLLKSLEIDDSSTVLASILGMTKLIDEFVAIEEVYKTTIWSCSLKLVFHELMWKMLEYRANPQEENGEVILDIKDRLIDLISPADCVPENLESLTLEAFERSCTEINVLADLGLLFSASKSGSNSKLSSNWCVVILEDQIMALLSFVKMTTGIVADALPRREHESFELARAAKKAYPGIMASLAKLFSLEIIPNKFLSSVFLTFGFGNEISDAVIRVVIERFVSKMSWDRIVPIIGTSLQESYLLTVMSSEYEHMINSTTITLAKLFNDQLRLSASISSTESAMFDLHSVSLQFLQVDCAQRAEFIGRVLTIFTWNLSVKQAEELINKVKSLNYTDSFIKIYIRSLEKICNKGNVAQRLLMKRSQNISNNNNSNNNNNNNQKNSKLEMISETEAEAENENENENETDNHNINDHLIKAVDHEEEEYDEKASIDYVGGINYDLVTQKEQVQLDQIPSHIPSQIPSSPPAILRRKVTRY